MAEKYLQKFLKKEVLVVQVDGNAFKGTLIEYDDRFLVMENIIQTSTKQRNWFRVTVAVPRSGAPSKDKLIGGTIVGDTESMLLELKTALISLDHIMRIWLWTPKIVEEATDFRIQS
jgi:small nuclear ribonucleoprotein (snRNP)-like protein